MRTPRTLTARLVATVVALVTVVSLLIATFATIAIRSQLMDRLDANVMSSVRRVGGNPGDGDRDNAPPPDASNQGPGTLIALVDPGGTSQGIVLTEQRGGEMPLSTAEIEQLAKLPEDGRVHALDLVGLGSYRVAARRTPSGETLVSGLPTHDVDETVSSLVGYEALLILVGLLTAAGFGWVVVRRQLAPLREVAETAHRVSDLPLSSGAIDLEERVPERLTDEGTEVGQMGAALNTLLNHVET